MHKKECIELLEEEQERLQNKIDKNTKHLKILVEHLVEIAPETEKKALEILKKAINYWG